jgi:hypothetical protein
VPAITRGELVNQELAREFARKDSLERRGITVITASGVLVTLAFGFATAVAKGHHYANFTTPEKLVLDIAMAFFILSAIFALFTNTPRNYGVPQIEALKSSPDSGSSPDEGMSEVVLGKLVSMLEAARRADDNKALALVISMYLQLTAILLLGVAVGIVVA